MTASRFLSLSLVLWALSAAGCGNAVLGVQLQLVTKACPGALTGDAGHDPAAGVTELRIRVTGDNIAPILTTVPFSSGGAQIPNVPIGSNRRVTVEALKGGLLRARADSGPFEAVGQGDIKLTLFLRVVDAFTLAGDAAGATCTQMAFKRAGHAMALLPDGKVLITGGFDLASGQLVPHSEAEIFDPATGQFSQAAPARFQRSGHAALSVQVGPAGGGVLLLGGEGPAPSGGGAPVKPLELYSSSGWSTIQPSSSSQAREHQAAAVDARTGYALLAGGQSGPDSGQAPTVLTSLSYYDPQSGAVKDSATLLPKPLTDAVAVARVNSVRSGPSQGGVVLVGGRDGTLHPSNQISGLIWRDTSNDFWNDSTFATGPVSVLPTPRVKHVAVRLGCSKNISGCLAQADDDTVLTAGGVTAEVDNNDYSSATDAVTIIDSGQQYVADVAKLVQARADSCAAVLEDGSVLIAGGAWKDGNGLHSARFVDLVVPAGRATTVRNLMGPAQGDWALQQGRTRAACLRLRDGSVLVTGGLQYPEGGGTPTVLQSAEIYTPVGPAQK